MTIFRTRFAVLPEAGHDLARPGVAHAGQGQEKTIYL